MLEKGRKGAWKIEEYREAINLFKTVKDSDTVIFLVVIFFRWGFQRKVGERRVVFFL